MSLLAAAAFLRPAHLFLRPAHLFLRPAHLSLRATARGTEAAARRGGQPPSGGTIHIDRRQPAHIQRLHDHIMAGCEAGRPARGAVRIWR